VGILVTFVPPKVTARRGMSDMPTRGTAQTPKRNVTQQQRQNTAAAAKHSGKRLTKTIAAKSNDYIKPTLQILTRYIIMLVVTSSAQGSTQTWRAHVATPKKRLH